MRLSNNLLPYEPERRLLKALWFLSLDLTREFFKEMWVPVSDPVSFQQHLRRSLGPIDDEQLYYAVPGSILAAVSASLSTEYSTDTQSQLALWAKRIFVSGGPDRLPETLWSWIISHMANHPELVPDVEVIRFARDVRIAEERLSGSRRERLATAMASEPGSWDKQLASRDILQPDAVRTKVSLITSYNEFAIAWEQHCSGISIAALEKVFEIGVAIGQQNNMFTQGTPFPGSWRLDLLPFMRAHG